MQGRAPDLRFHRPQRLAPYWHWGGMGGPGAASPQGNMQDPYGMTLIANYAMVAKRHMFQYGTTSEQLARIAVATRAHAMRNPEAVQAMMDSSSRASTRSLSRML